MGTDNMHTIIIDENVSNITVGISSVIGRRKEQQDTIKTDDDYALIEHGKFIAVLCDGMGGLSGGQQASNLCADFIVESFHSVEKIDNIQEFYRVVIAESDRRILKLCDENGERLHAGTTLASVVIQGNTLHWASVGDSHIYLIRNGQIQCITNDHNYLMILQEKIEQGELTKEEAEEHPKKEALVSYVGMGGVKYIDINTKPFELINGDYIVICSDGLYRTVSEEDIKGITCGIEDAKDVAACLTEYAMRAEKSNQDNTSVIVIQYKE